MNRQRHVVGEAMRWVRCTAALLLLSLSAVAGAQNVAPDRSRIFLESTPVTAHDREARELTASRTKTRRAADLNSSLRKLSRSRWQSNYYLVRVRGPRVADVKARMEELGARVESYVQFYAFVVKMNGAVLDQVAQLEEVEWVGPYKAEHRVARALNARRAFGDENEELRLDVYLFTLDGLPEVSSFVRDQGGTVEAEVQNPAVPKVRARLPAKCVDLLSAIPVVRLICEYVPETFDNDKAATIMGVPAVWNAHGLTGSNQIVGHADSGLDVGSTGVTMNADFRGRIVAAFALGRSNDWSDFFGHGTHTAGSILGNGTNSSGLYRGVACEAKLVHQAVSDRFSGPTGIPADYGTLFGQAYSNGARIHSDSWGLTNGYYRAVEADAWLWNGGRPRDMLIVVSAGNDGPDRATVDRAPAVAKNVLTVGATENARPGFGEDGDNTNEVVDFSSRGPTDESRVKPDIVAPGTWVASVKTHGAIMAFADDMEHGTNGMTVDPAGGPWKQKKSVSRSSSTSWNYTNSGVFAHYLRTPYITLPYTSCWLRLFWRGSMQGTSGSSRTYLKVCYRMSGDTNYYNLLPLSLPIGQSSSSPPYSVTYTNWQQFYFPMPTNAFGTNLQWCILVTSRTASASADIYIDDISVGSFFSTGDMWDHGLAARGDNIDSNYTLESGTSMAAPLTAGAAALTRQFYQERRSCPAPSAALIKGTLINGATSLTPGIPRPDCTQGWGRVNLEYSLFPPPPRSLVFFDQTNGLDEGQQEIFRINVTNASEELRATLAWSDREGATLQNDLDLLLVRPDGISTGRADSINNVEGIDVSSPATGIWSVVVEGQTVPYGPQPFALILSGSIVTVDERTLTHHFLLYTQGFNSVTAPSGWATQLVYASGTTSPALSFVTNSVYPGGLAAYEGLCFVAFNSASCASGCQYRLLQTNAISTVHYTNIVADFAWARGSTYSSYFNDFMEVQWSTSGAEWVSVSTNYRHSTAGGTAAWYKVSAVLPAGAENRTNLFLAFLFTSRHGRDCHLDDLRVTGEPGASTLRILASQGPESPPEQVRTNRMGSWVTNRIATPVTIGSTQYECSGWAMTGNEPASGSTTGFTMQVTNDATLTWLWTTNYYLALSVSGSGSVNQAGGWYRFASNVVAVASPSNFYHLGAWVGDTAGCAAVGNQLTIPVTQPRQIVARFDPDLAPLGTPTWWMNLYGLTGGSFAVQETNDTDSDGMPAWQEWTADTDPTNPGSFLDLLRLSRSGTDIRVTWQGGQQATQFLEKGFSIYATGLQWLVIATNAPATPLTNTFAQPAAPGTSVFYRIRAAR